VAALHEAGFGGLLVLSNEERLEELARELDQPDLADDPIDSDLIVLRERFEDLVTAPLVVVRLPSGEMAQTRYENDRPLLEGRIPSDVREALPPDFDPSRFREERICNVVIHSYNGADDAELPRRFERATELLRWACG
jgi:hypothetical protein